MPKKENEPQDTVRKEIYCDGIDVAALAEALAAWYVGQNYEVQFAVQDLARGRFVLQCRTKPGWRVAVGMSNAMDVGLSYADPRLTMTLSTGAWANLAVAGTVGVVGMFTAAPLLVPLAGTAAVGWWKKAHIPDRTVEFVEGWVRANQGRSAQPNRSDFRDKRVREGSARNDIGANDPRAGGSPREQDRYTLPDDILVGDFDTPRDQPNDEAGKSRERVADRIGRESSQRGKACAVCGSRVAEGSRVCAKGHRQPIP